MAEDKKKRIRKTETIRERSEKAVAAAEKQPKRRLRKTANAVGKPFGFLRVLKFIIPPYFRNAWKELRQVTWPSRRETRQLTIAVFLFAIVFGVLVALTDYGLDKIFRKVLLK